MVRTMADLPRLVDALPVLATSLRSSLLERGEQELAAQIDSLRVHATCGCGEGCLSVYLAPRRASACKESRVAWAPDVVVDIGVCDGQIEYLHDDVVWWKDDNDYRRARAAEYEALEGRVPTRLPQD